MYTVISLKSEPELDDERCENRTIFKVYILMLSFTFGLTKASNRCKFGEGAGHKAGQEKKDRYILFSFSFWCKLPIWAQ